MKLVIQFYEEGPTDWGEVIYADPEAGPLTKADEFVSHVTNLLNFDLTVRNAGIWIDGQWNVQLIPEEGT